MSGQATRARYTAHVARALRGPARTADYLAKFRARGFAAYPSQRRIAEDLGIHVRTVQRHLAILEQEKFLAVERHKPHHDSETGRWRRKTNRYRCQFRRNGPVTRGDPRLAPRRHFWRDEVPTGTRGTAGGASGAPHARVSSCSEACPSCEGVGWVEPVLDEGWIRCPETPL